jgi:hypothetical protein
MKTLLLNSALAFAALALFSSASRADEATIRSVTDGPWSNPKTWEPARAPKAGDRVLVTGGTRVEYDAKSDEVIQSIRVAGHLSFSAEKDTVLNVGYIRVQPGDATGDAGVDDVDKHGSSGTKGHGHGGGHGHAKPKADETASLEIGLPGKPIASSATARIRLHYIEGMDKEKTPAIVCRPGGRMEFHGAPMSRTWVKLGADSAKGSDTVTLGEAVTGWRVGDEIIVTGTEKPSLRGTFRPGDDQDTEPQTEKRRISAIDGLTVKLDKALDNPHAGSGEFRGEIANLSRNVIVESADPDGVRGHTMFHWGSAGSISYARFAHLGKEGVLGRYPIHFHLVEDTMRGSSVIGASIVDSHNRWVTIHGTQYLLVRDCVGYESVGHGFFLEDGTEVSNVLDRNLGVHAYAGPRMKGMPLSFDQNDGAAFWWGNGWNTFTRNIGVESDQYGFRYDMQHRGNFNSTLPIRQPDGGVKEVDVRTLPITRFEANEAHGNFAGMVVAANGDSQPDTGIKDQSMLDKIRSIDWTGPDTKHPHVIRDFKIWSAHYAFRPHSPAMLIEDLRIDNTTYGVYRPAFDNQVYRNVHLSRAGGEPFNRGMDDASAQNGSITVDGLILEHFPNSSQPHPLVHMTDNNLTGVAECHFRNVVMRDNDPRRAIFNRGGSTRVDPFVDKGVPYFVHDHFGPGKHAKIVSIRAAHLIKDGNDYKEMPPLTGDESRVAEVKGLAWPQLLDPTDDLPPSTIILSIRKEGEKIAVHGVSHDNSQIVSVKANGVSAEIVSQKHGVADWTVTIPAPEDGIISALAADEAGNSEKTPHESGLAVK